MFFTLSDILYILNWTLVAGGGWFFGLVLMIWLGLKLKEFYDNHLCRV